MKNGLKQAILSVLIASASTIQAFAVPAYRELISYPTADGDSIDVYLHGDEHSRYYTTKDGYPLIPDDNANFCYAIVSNGKIEASTMFAANPDKRTQEANTLLRTVKKEHTLSILTQSSAQPNRKRVAPEYERATFPSKGSTRAIVILVEFSDNSFTVNNPNDTFYRMLNEDGFNEYSATGSARDYFSASSNGLFTPQFDVYGPVKLPQPMIYYGRGSDDANAHYMIAHACEALDNVVDFSIYDTDNDGKIDNVYVFYAGYGEADGGSTNTVWPHSWDLYSGAGVYSLFDGKLLDHYATSNELKARTTTLAGIGTFCHEFGHVLGLPDLYATDYSSSFTPGAYSIMDYGSYSNDSHTPPTYTGYERYCLDWVTPTELFAPEIVSLGSISDEGGYEDVRIIKTDNENEYFILENRQQKDWDTYIPGHGMLIWHINYNAMAWNSNTCNNSAYYQRIDIEEADNSQSEYDRDGDTFPGASGVTSFTDETMPSMLTWDDKALNAPITEITEENGIISFKFRGGKSSIDYIKIIANEATDITSNGFVANWEKVIEANNYQITLYTEKTTNPIEDKASFDKGVLPTGWVTSGTRNITNDASFAVELPSRELYLSKSSITTPTYESDINQFSFWYRSSEDHADNALIIKGSVNGIDMELTTISPLKSAVGGETVTIKDIPEGCRKLSIVFSKGSGFVAIDNINVTYGIKTYMSPIDEFVDIATGDVNSYKFEGLNDNTKYGYSVTGIDSSSNTPLLSIPSDIITVTTHSGSGIENVSTNATTTIATNNNHITVSTTDATNIAIYDISGRLVDSAIVEGNSFWVSDKLSGGIYIVNTNNTSTKVAL